MEKISFYDLLSLLLPGSLLSLFLIIFTTDLGAKWDIKELNEYYQLILFLSSAFIIGSGVNILTRVNLNVYKKIGIYTSIYKIYQIYTSETVLKSYYQKLLDLGNDHSVNETKVEAFWSEMYYELEATEKISVPKSFQSFYFFFRNFITLAIIVILLIAFMLLFSSSSDEKYTYLLVAAIITILISGVAARWNRKKMVDRMFWTYYSLNKK